jgi:hypothetical protein
MITSAANAGNHLQSTQTYSSRNLTRADALSAAEAYPTGAPVKTGIAIATLKPIDASQLRIVSVRDVPEIRDMMATAWLDAQAANKAWANMVSDDAPQNTYATVKVDGKVVATLYNGGSVTMTNEAGAKVGDLEDQHGLKGGPDLAQSRAELIAKAVGGTVEKAATAITQSEWKPRETTSSDYTRKQLDAAFEAMIAEQQKMAAQQSGGYQAPLIGSRGLADVSA